MKVQIEMAPRHANDRRAASRQRDANILARETAFALGMLAIAAASVALMALAKSWGVW